MERVISRNQNLIDCSPRNAQPTYKKLSKSVYNLLNNLTDKQAKPVIILHYLFLPFLWPMQRIRLTTCDFECI